MAERSSSIGQRFAAAALWLACAWLVSELLGALAARQNEAALDAAARTRITAAITGAPLATWPLTSTDDIIAGRVFGRSQFALNDEGLRIESQGEAVEFGVPLQRQLDAQRYPIIRLQVTGDSRFRYQWSAAATDIAAPCRSPPQPVQQGHIESRLDRLTWSCADGSTRTSTPTLRYLRLVVDGPAAATTQLRYLQIGPASPLQLPDRSTIPAVHSMNDVAAAVTALREVPVSTLPIAVVPKASRLPPGLSFQRAFPAVVVVSSLDVLDTPATASPPRAVVTVTLLLILLAIWARPPADDRWRAAAQLLAALLMPLWLSVGGRLGIPFNGIDAALLIAGAVYLLLRLFDSKAWVWLGSPRAWLLPALSVMLALGLAALIKPGATPDVRPTALDAIRYLAWAGVQQWILMTVVADRLSGLGWSSRWVALGSAALFALLHSPNEPLMLLTLIGGVLWTWNWQRHRALLPNVLAHAACGLIAMSCYGGWLSSAEVGSRFFAG